VSDVPRQPSSTRAESTGADGSARPRRSACARDARARESRRILALSPTERALLALDLGERYARWGKGDT
jgi:hypothetical protein